MKRLAEKYLENWAQSDNPKPLMIRGARQTGKSTLVRNFAKQEGYKLFEINLEKYPLLDKVFASLNIQEIILELEGILNQKIKSKNSLLFLDEIQATPHAIAALRYFYEEMPGLKVIAAGSLLEFALKDHSFSMPVGRVQYLYLGPMKFEEWLMALGEDYLLEGCKNFSFKEASKNTISKTAHESLVKLLRIYFLTGGMPEAVKVYKESSDFKKVKEVQKSIVLTYQDDFTKYARNKDLPLLQQVLLKGVQTVNQKVKYTNFSKEHNSKQLKEIIELLCRARIFSKIIHSDANGLPLNAESDLKTYKLSFLDVGLMLSFLGLDIYQLKKIDDFSLVNEGVIAEQFIAQHLLYNSDFQNLNYWLREKKKGNAELDYLLAYKAKVLPVEVKAGKSGSLKSLREFVIAKNSKMALRFDLSLPSEQDINFDFEGRNISFKLVSLPIYLIDEYQRVLSEMP